MSTTSSTKSTQSSHDALRTRLNEGNAVKEVRAHEHARHRTKERRDHALAKGRKEKAAAVRVLGLKVNHGVKLVRKLSMESWDGEDPEEQRSVTTPSVREPVQAHEHDVAPPRDSTSSFTALTLGDLISRPRRPKAKRELFVRVFGAFVDNRMCVSEFDFEVIPPIRPVIALDDADADEPWEYITRASLNDGSAWKGKSYAQAVVCAM